MEDFDPQPADTTRNATRNHSRPRMGTPLPWWLSARSIRNFRSSFALFLDASDITSPGRGIQPRRSCSHCAIQSAPACLSSAVRGGRQKGDHLRTGSLFRNGCPLAHLRTQGTAPAFTPSMLAPFRYGSGCGFPCVTSLLVSRNCGKGSPAARMLVSASRRVHEVTIAQRSSGSVSSNSLAPGSGTTPSRSSTSRRSTSRFSASWSASGKIRGSCSDWAARGPAQSRSRDRSHARAPTASTPSLPRESSQSAPRRDRTAVHYRRFGSLPSIAKEESTETAHASISPADKKNIPAPAVNS